MGFLTGKRALITGVISQRSIAAGIATAMHREGAELAFSYQGEKIKDRVVELASQWNSTCVLPCDVQSDAEIATLFEALQGHWPEGFDILVHSIAFAPGDQLSGDYLSNVTREGFKTAHEISSYSFAALAKAAMPMMEGRAGALLTLSYLGAERAMPSYNVMGLAKASLEANVRYMALSVGNKNIRVNGISAGPLKTLASAGIKGFKDMSHHMAVASPMKRNVSLEEVGNAAAFLCSDLASGITGEILHVDAGFSTVAMTGLE